MRFDPKIVLKNYAKQKYLPLGFSMSTISSLKSIENKHDV